MADIETIATEILAKIGGVNNIANLLNCMSRVRVELKDESLFDPHTIKDIPGVFGYVKQGTQHQIVVGPGTAEKVVLAMLLEMEKIPPPPIGDAATVKAKVKEKYQLSVSYSLKKIAEIFIPLIPAFIAGGLFLSLANLLQSFSGIAADKFPSLIPFLKLLGNSIFSVSLGGSVFSLLSVFVGINTARVFGGTPVLGGMLGVVLAAPTLKEINFLGSQLVPGRGGVIAVILGVIFMCYVERFLKKLIPEALDLILTPLLTLLISVIVALAILQPIGGLISDGIAQAATYLVKNQSGGILGGLVGALLAGAFLPLVMTGLHQGLAPLHIELLQILGSNPLFPVLAMAGAGQVGAAIAVYIRTKNRQLKKVILGGLPAGVLGVGEPLIYGVTLPLGKPFLTACVGAAIGGAFVFVFKVSSLVPFGVSGLPLALSIVTGKTGFYLLGWMISAVGGCFATLASGFTDPLEVS